MPRSNAASAVFFVSKALLEAEMCNGYTCHPKFWRRRPQNTAMVSELGWPEKEIIDAVVQQGEEEG